MELLTLGGMCQIGGIGAWILNKSETYLSGLLFLMRWLYIWMWAREESVNKISQTIETKQPITFELRGIKTFHKSVLCFCFKSALKMSIPKLKSIFPFKRSGKFPHLGYLAGLHFISIFFLYELISERKKWYLEKNKKSGEKSNILIKKLLLCFEKWHEKPINILFSSRIFRASFRYDELFFFSFQPSEFVWEERKKKKKKKKKIPDFWNWN